MCLLRARVWWDGVALFKGKGQIRCISLVAGHAQTPVVINWSVCVSCQAIKPCLVFGAMLSSMFDGRRMFGVNGVGWL